MTDSGATTPWLASEIEENAGHPDMATLMSESVRFDVEPAIASLRRQYILARMGGWPTAAAIRIAAKNVIDIIDAETRPTLSVISGDK
jgi:hypothetical protein